MNLGLLWYDANADKDLMKTIDDAAARYQKKYGVAPEICYVNRQQLKEFGIAHRDALPSVNAPDVIGNDKVVRNHVWIGRKENAQ